MDAILLCDLRSPLSPTRFKHRLDPLNRVGLRRGFVFPVAPHSSKPQGQSPGITRALLEIVIGDLNHQFRLHINGHSSRPVSRESSLSVCHLSISSVNPLLGLDINFSFFNSILKLISRGRRNPAGTPGFHEKSDGSPRFQRESGLLHQRLHLLLVIATFRNRSSFKKRT